ncbi:periplasmic sensor signal transduction histidine kinase [Novosphingobium sp. PY1]|uniref:histidine kinase n=2 Tax=Alphaproteobacteria TaxID=28211 RepID=A0A292GT53_9HYPH|nr:periplasmic sensor signal transduction histidine kinase [Ochrobactrum sp. PW1]GFM29121.1 periplasmic sensor signal transduction histidine kinase [Novosphingobium sp. PY1]
MSQVSSEPAPARSGPEQSNSLSSLGLPRNLGLAGWPLPAMIFVITSILAVALKPVLDGEVSSGLIFVLGITLVGAYSGLLPALIATVLASAFFNFFLADPVLTFRMSTGNDLAPPVIFTACGVVSGLLAGRLKDKTFQLGQTNLQLEGLLETSRMLQAAPDVTAIETALSKSVLGRLGYRVSLYTLEGGRLKALALADNCAVNRTLANDAIRSCNPAEAGTCVALRLDGSRSCVGAMVIEGERRRWFDLDFLEAMARLVGLALEAAQFASIVAETRANARTEELKSALLSSVSHDLRTPLTAISASASSLIEFGNQLDSETSRSLLQGIVDECARLNRFTANLLEMSRLQAEGGKIEGQVLSANDIVRAVVHRLRTRNADRDITILTGCEDVLVIADAALFELALTNVIQNALIYSPSFTKVMVTIDCVGDVCRLTVTDAGCGIPPEEQWHVFDRFYRVKRSEPSPQGSGLGLAIAKGFVEAFEGSIELNSPILSGQGTKVTIRLPVFKEAIL